MEKKIFHALMFFVLASVSAPMPEPGLSPLPKTNAPNVIIIPVSGTVDAAMTAFISRAINESKRYHDAIIVLEIDTYGGEVDAAFKIVDTLLSIRGCPIIAYIKTKAISAGTLIALSCQRVYMKHNTTIGDVAPLMVSQEGPKMLGEKFQSPIRAKFRILAKRNGYPERLTEALVTTGMRVFEVKFSDTTIYLDSNELADLSQEKRTHIVSTRTVVKRDELLTMDDVEAKTLSFSRMSVASEREMLESMGYTSPAIIRIKKNWSEELVKFLAVIAPVLMTIGIGLLYIEFKTPGLVLPGVVGAICLAIVFFGQYMVGLANYTDILLAITGLALIAVEIFLFPTFGLLAVSGASLLIIAMVLSFQGFVLPRPEFPWQQHTMLVNLAKVFSSFILAGGISFLFIKYGVPRLGTMVKGPYLTDTLSDTTTTSGLVIPVTPGDKGVVVTALRPAGRARFNSEEIDVVSNGEFIEKGASVEVSQIQGTRIVVQRERNA
jgi:membrane-bound serine protease (ClpP class)